MSKRKILNGTVRIIPETNETDWGDDMTAVTCELIDKAEQPNTINPVGIQLQENPYYGTHKITLKAPPSVSYDYSITLPQEDGTTNQYLKRNSSGVMQWADGTVTSSLDQAYDNGRIITTDAGPVQIQGAGGLEVTGPAILTGDVTAGASISFKGPRPWVDVTAYGVLGDGVTDDGPALAALVTTINAISRVNGYDAITMFFPRGHYKYSNTLEFTSPICIRGEEGTLLDYTGTGYAIKMGPDGLTNVTYIDHLTYTIEDICFIGGTSYTHGIYWNTFITQPLIRRCKFRDFGNATGYQLYYQSSNWLIKIDECVMWSAIASNFMKSRGYTVGGVADNGNSRLLMTNCHLWSNSTDAIGVWINGTNSIISKTSIQGLTPAIRLGSWANYCEIDSCYFETISTVSGSKVIEFGDPDNTDGRLVQKIQGTKIHDNYCNLHISPLIGAAIKYFVGPSGTNTSTGLVYTRFENNNLTSASDSVEAIKLNDVTYQIENVADKNFKGATNTYLSALTTSGTNIVPWRLNNKKWISGISAPALGTWGAGDICWNSTPATNGGPGWMCVTSGTPGKWRQLDPVFNVADFGAIGDGSNDDTAAIQNAINAAGDHGTVYFPKTTTNIWAITSALTFHTGQKWIGCGTAPLFSASTEIRLTSAASYLLGPDSPTSTTHGFTAKNIYFNAQSFANDAVYLYNCSYCIFDTCAFTTTVSAGNGVLVDADTSLHAYFNQFINCRAYDCSGIGATGFAFVRGANCNLVLGGKTGSCYNGMKFTGSSSGNSVIATDFEDNTDKHAYIDAPNNQFSNVHMESCPIGFDITINGYGTGIVQPTFATTVTTQIQNAAKNITELVTRDDGSSTIGSLGFGASRFVSDYVASESNIYYDPYLYSGTSHALMKFFKNINTSGTKKLYFYKGDGTTNTTIEMNAGTGEIWTQFMRFGTYSGPIIISGSGSPEGVVTAPVGSLFLSTSGILGFKETGAGNTGWKKCTLETIT